MISDSKLDNLRRLTIVQKDPINQEIYLALTELKQRIKQDKLFENELKIQGSYISELETKLTRLKDNLKLLERIEKRDYDFNVYTECPVCGKRNKQNHSKNCWLGKAIKEEVK